MSVKFSKNSKISMTEKINPQINVRLGRKEDLKEICEIERKSFPTSWPRSSFEHLLLQNSNIFLVASVGGRVVGYAIATVERSFSLSNIFNKKGHLLKIAVEEEMRRQGVGTSLLRSLEEKYRERDVEKIELEARIRNDEARKFYKKNEFEEKELIKNYYPDGANAVLMVKKID